MTFYRRFIILVSVQRGLIPHVSRHPGVCHGRFNRFRILHILPGRGHGCLQWKCSSDSPVAHSAYRRALGACLAIFPFSIPYMHLLPMRPQIFTGQTAQTTSTDRPDRLASRPRNSQPDGIQQRIGGPQPCLLYANKRPLWFGMMDHSAYHYSKG